MYAYVPSIPGTVKSVSEVLPSDTSNWYPCGSMVTTEWTFDGNAFVAPIPPFVPPVIPAS